jgi:translation initiation factor IF-3
MNRESTWPDGCKNLNDNIRVISAQGADLGFLTVTEAQRLATEQHAKLVKIARGRGMNLFRLVDPELRSRLRQRR